MNELVGIKARIADLLHESFFVRKMARADGAQSGDKPVYAISFFSRLMRVEDLVHYVEDVAVIRIHCWNAYIKRLVPIHDWHEQPPSLSGLALNIVNFTLHKVDAPPVHARRTDAPNIGVSTMVG
jgi:hypothetical protein